MSVSTIMSFRKCVRHFFVVVLCMPLVAACDSNTHPVLESHESQKYSFSRFIENIESFPYTAAQSKLSKVREGFKRLSLGTGKGEIKKIMGEPDSETMSYKPTKKNKGLIYSTWGYYLKRSERNLATDGFDATVVLYFKPNGELYWADPINVAGLKVLGGPQLHPEALVDGTPE